MEQASGYLQDQQFSSSSSSSAFFSTRFGHSKEVALVQLLLKHGVYDEKINKKVSGKNLNLTFKMCVFFFLKKILKRGNFILQILQKYGTYRTNVMWHDKAHEKYKKNCQFRIWIIKILSQRFFHLKFIFFLKFQKLKNLKNAKL